MIRICGLQKMTLLDYPGKVACTVFLGGCDMRCPFCHNSELTDGSAEPVMTEEELLAFLVKRKGLLEGVAVTGGEPLLREENLNLLREIRALGYPVKLDTNGTHPDRLRRVLEEGLAQYVAMDVKNSPDRYAETIGLKAFELTPVMRSVSLLKESGTDYEFRTTVAAELHDENSIRAARTALAVADGLGEEDIALVLLSGGGSALFEESLIPPEAQREITKKLLARGAAIEEINAVRRRISAVKGGKFAARCYPARVITFALSDVLNDDKSVIASGITVRDGTPDGFVKAVADKYLYDLDHTTAESLYHKKELTLNDGGYHFVGNIDRLCEAAKVRAEALGYRAVTVSKALTGEAREQAASILAAAPERSGKRAYIYGGETTVTLKGNGLGGRNQEMALAAAIALKDRAGIAFCSVGSDGTDGPTDAAGGYADGDTYAKMQRAGVTPEAALADNDSYHALKAAGDLIVTGPTGTNVNDLTFVLTDER